MSWITAPFAWLLKALYDLTGSYGWAVVLFGVVVNLILLPFMAKSKKSMMRTTRLQPRITELQRRHEGNQQKLNEEMAKLYREEKINPMSGCLWSLIPFPILIALYSVIRQPLTKMMGLGAEAVTQLTDWVTTNAGYVAQAKSAYQEIQIADLIHQNWDAVTGALGDYSGKLLDLDYSFIGLNMGQQPSFKIWTFDWSNKAVWLPALGLFLIPIISALLSWLSMKISTSMTPQPAGNQQAAATNKTMMLMMPLVSLWICYTMPAALGIYWIVNSILGILRDVSLTKVFNKQLDKLYAERIAREKERDAELERKRLETPTPVRRRSRPARSRRMTSARLRSCVKSALPAASVSASSRMLCRSLRSATAAMRVAVPMRGIIISRTRLPLRRRSCRCPRVPKENRRVLNDVKNTGKVRQDGRGGHCRRARGAWP